jgi:carboxylate-amine ligase
MKEPLSREQKVDNINFKSNGVLTIGAEVELQVIDPSTYNLSPRAEEILNAAAHLEKIKPEFYLSTIEINTGICNNAQEIESDLQETLKALLPITNDLGIKFSTTGAHPFAKYADCIISPGARYQELIDRNQWLTRRMTVYGLHVHLGMASGDDCIRFNNFFMHFLPHLLALSASSPFWQGVDTGLSSYRPTTYEAIPTAGQPYQVNTWHEFENLYKTLLTCNSIKLLKDLWWDLRPSPEFGTLEIRVCDGPATLYETLAIVAFVHALSHWFADNGSWLESMIYPPSWQSRENKWRSIRYGLEAELVVGTEGKTKPLLEDLYDWLNKLQPYIEKFGYQDYINNLFNIVKYGTSTARQKRVFQKTNSLRKIVAHNLGEFIEQVPCW